MIENCWKSSPRERVVLKTGSGIEPTVMIPEPIYQTLLSSHNFLSALQTYGVDNWEGYENALNLFKSLEDIK